MSAPETWTKGDLVIWPNGTVGEVMAVDFDDLMLMDHCGGWHNMADVEREGGVS